MTPTFYILWVLAFLGFPIGGALTQLVIGSVSDVPRAALAGLITGLVIGLAEWLVLRSVVALDLRWVVFTGAGMAVGLALGVALTGIETAGVTLIVRAAITGLVIGLAQWLLLRDFAPMAGWWILALGIAWALSWTITRAVGVDMTKNWSVFGSSGAIIFQIVTALALRLLVGPGLAS